MAEGMASRSDRIGTRHRLVLSLILIVLVTALVRVPLLGIPFERDEGGYAYIAWRLGEGELPYREWVDQKPPAIFWVYRAALALPGDPVRAVHLALLLFSAATACALYFLALRMVGRGWALLAACLFAVLSADPLVQGTAANTEQFMLLPLVLALDLFLRRADSGELLPRYAVLIGVLTGVATAFKQVAVVNAVLLVAVHPFFLQQGAGRRGTLAFALRLASGFLGVWGIIALYFLARGGLSQLVYHVFTHNLGYIQAIPMNVRWSNFSGTVSVLARSQAVVWLTAGAGIILLARSGRRALFLLMAGLLAASMAGVSASGYYFPHYFQQVLPALALLAAFGAEAMARTGPLQQVPAGARTASIVVLLALLPFATSAPFLFRYSPAEAVRAIYPGNYFAEMPAIASRVAAVTGPDDRIFIFGAEPEVLFYARRVSATRYIYLFPLYGPYPNAREKQEAVAREVAQARPAAAVYLPNRLFSMPGSEQYFTAWSRDYLRYNFLPDTYLATDPAGRARVISRSGNGSPALPTGHGLVGAVLVRAEPTGKGRIR